jgi:uncharacterized protein
MTSSNRLNLRKIAGRTALIISGLLATPLILLAWFQAKLIYFPRPYDTHATQEWQNRTHGKPIDFTTSQGKQRAFLQGQMTAPRNLWIVCSGNGSVALDWSEWIQDHAPKEDAWLLVDYPGYGDCEGSPNPKSIQETFKTLIPLAQQTIGWNHPDLQTGHLRFFGHSLGCATSLMAASEFGIQRGVLVSPFTSTMAMSQVKIGIPLGFLVSHRYDNSARLAELAARGSGKVIIFHGTNDQIIPISMSRLLAKEQKQIVHLREIPGGRHNDISRIRADEMTQALIEIGKDF